MNATTDIESLRDGLEKQKRAAIRAAIKRIDEECSAFALATKISAELALAFPHTPIDVPQLATHIRLSLLNGLSEAEIEQGFKVECLLQTALEAHQTP